jgi:signal transduction histidine kinase
VDAELATIIRMFTHAMTTPLWAMEGFLDLSMPSRTEATGGPPAVTSLQHVRQIHHHLLDLVKGMARLGSVCRAELDVQRVNLSAVVRREVGLLEEAHPGRGMHADIQDGVSVMADTGLIALAVRTLLENAWKFTRGQPRPAVQFGTLAPGNPECGGADTVTCYLCDNGIGFDEELSDKLFAPYQRLHADPELAGMGMGLACVRRIIHRHGGRVWAHGKPNQGATFFIVLPA